MKRAAIAAFLVGLFCAPAQAGNQTGFVNYVTVRASDGLIYVTLTGSREWPPPCATGGYWAIRDENSNVGKQQYAMLLAAQVAGKRVQMIGSNGCQRWGDAEDVNEIRIVD